MVNSATGIFSRMVFPSRVSLVRQLSQAVRPATKPQRRDRSRVDISSRGRVNIVSPNLCDDALKQLAPSLVAYKNCDIIDVNPGNGLWSSMLHDHLKPRTHLLLEPEECYLPSLRPLLDKLGSTYRHVPYSGMEWSSYEKIIDNGLLPNQRLLKEGDPGYNSTNKTLLFLANLASHPEKKFGDFKSISHLMIHQLITAIRRHEIFQRYGLVRMLIWTKDIEKKALLPRTVANRRRFTVQAEMACEKIQEVAGAEGGPGKNRRDMVLDIASSKRVAIVTGQDDIKIPENRKGSIDEAIQEGHSQGATGIEGHDTYASGRLWHQELNELERGYRNNEFSRFVTEVGRQWGRNRVFTQEYKRLAHLRAFALTMKKKNTVVDKLLKREEELEMAEELAMLMGSEQRDEELAKLAEKYKDELTAFSESVQDKLALASDDRKALTMDPPLLMWDRRTKEPIIVKAEEFQPQQPLTLLDLHPKPFPAGLCRTSDSQTYFDFVVSCLFLQPKQSVVRGLDTLAPGAADDIVPLAPSLRDPKKGGRRNLEQLRVRMLTAEMIEELVVAWENWPFKPSMGELMLKMGVHRFTATDRRL
ncbi:MAG: hypothetical protein M1813_006184 [Trichoglossum hirsutum]|nr:MAG: hypothetical protein M1813_006184 [Trichoglossum hirsutum]